MLAFLLPLAGIAGLFIVGLPKIAGNGHLLVTFAGVAILGTAWLLSLTRVRTRVAVTVFLRPQHYLQAIAHTAILGYWGFYWEPMRDAAGLIAAQILFAYVFDMLLTWSRRETYVLGFGPFPIVYSINLFLRFRDDWFAWQFLMIAVGLLAKEFIRWERDGKRVHVFNPSSFPLAAFSLGLILTGTTHLTWGEDIANLLILPPHIYLFIFLVSLPGQLMFRVTSMTLPAVLTTYLFSQAYLKITGTYFFFDSDIPIAVFLGMHLLFTDPSTSPRTELGRIIFGVIYGLSAVGLYALLGAVGAPRFYDKLLQVPLMNLSVRAIDRFAESASVSWLNPARVGRTLAPLRRSAVWVSLWVVAFGAMSSAKALGDYHPGHTVPFWYQACEEQRDGACHNLGLLYSLSCQKESGWACNELGVLSASRKVVAAPPRDLFSRACSLGFSPGCANAKAPDSAAAFRRGDPRPDDYLYLLQEGKGPLPPLNAMQLFERACDQHWVAACGNLGSTHLQGTFVPKDQAKAAALFERACDGGHADSCSDLGLMHRIGDGVPPDPVQARAKLKRACDLGMAEACRWLQTAGPP